MTSRFALIPIAAIIVGALSVGVASAATIAKPTALTATPISASAITLHWTDASTNEIGFEVQRSPGNKSAFKKIATTAVDATSYADSGLTAVTAYKYRVRALKNPTGASAFSNVATATTLGGTTDTTKPSVPAGLAGSASSCSQINLSWNASTDNTGGSGVAKYNLYRNNAFLKSITAPAISTSDTGLSASTSYTYAITAVDNANNESAKSPSVTATTPPCGGTVLPSVPTNVIASPVAGSCSSIIVAWYASTPGTNALKDYAVWRDGAFLKYVTAPTVSTADNGLAGSHTYSYTVQARDTLNNPSAQSTSVTGTTPACPTNPNVPVPQAFKANATSCAFALASWNAIFDPNNAYHVVKFNLYRNGMLAKTVNAPATTAVDTNLTALTTYSYAVTSVDASNHESAKSTPVSTTTPVCPPAGAWGKTIGTTSSEVANRVAVDGAGDVIVAGTFYGTSDFGGGPVTATGTHGDIFVAKYSAAHTLLWVDHFASSAPYTNDLSAVATDPAGNVFIAGAFFGTINLGGGPLVDGQAYRDAFVAKYSPSGAHQWSRRFGGTNEDVATGVAVDTSGNPVFTGYFRGTNVDFGGKTMSSGSFGGNSSFVVKYTSATGAVLLGFVTPCGSDNANGVAVDSADNIIITGTLSNQCNFGGGQLSSNNTDMYVAKYSPSGAYVWAKSFGGPQPDAGYAVAVDGSGNVFVTGMFIDTIDFGTGTLFAGGLDPWAFLVKLNGGNGSTAWAKAFGSVIADGYGVTADAHGNVTVVGTFSGIIDFGGGPLSAAGGVTSSGSSAFVAEYSASGAHLASNRYGEVGITQGYGVTNGPDGAIVTGGFTGTIDLGFGPVVSAGGYDFFILDTGA